MAGAFGNLGAEVDFPDFAKFAMYVMHGGFLGWQSELGIPECAQKGLQRLANTFISTPNANL